MMVGNFTFAAVSSECTLGELGVSMTQWLLYVPSILFGMTNVYCCWSVKRTHLYIRGGETIIK